MKKNLCALAVLTVCAAPVFAQTNVVIYGVADMGFVEEMGGPSGSVAKLTSGVASGSRLGFKGTEDLGGGLSARFVLEAGILMDTGASAQGGTFLGRQSFVGLDGGFGSITLGRQYTPLFNALSVVDPFYAFSLAGASDNLMSIGGIRMNNTVKYASPKVMGFSGEVAYGFGEVAGNIDSGRHIGATVGYQYGPLNIKLSRDIIDTVATTTVASKSGNTTLLGGTYDFSVAKLALAYAVNKGAVAIEGNPNANTRDALIGVTVPYGASTFLASYIHKSDKTAANLGARQWGVGYTYALSKRTDIYTSYARIRNRAVAGAAGFYTVGNASETGSGDKAFNVGLRHTF